MYQQINRIYAENVEATNFPFISIGYNYFGLFGVLVPQSPSLILWITVLPQTSLTPKFVCNSLLSTQDQASPVPKSRPLVIVGAGLFWPDAIFVGQPTVSVHKVKQQTINRLTSLAIKYLPRTLGRPWVQKNNKASEVIWIQTEIFSAVHMTVIWWFVLCSLQLAGFHAVTADKVITANTQE